MDVTVNPITITVTHPILPVDVGDMRLLSDLNDIESSIVLLFFYQGRCIYVGILESHFH